MSALATDLRNKLERTIIEARDVAEVGARAALESLATHETKAYASMSDAKKKLRNQLRAHARQLGDRQDPTGKLQIDHLVNECVYEHWHRMLFARFLAENNLLIEPGSGVAISLQECEELAKEAKVDLWTYASRCAQQMLPQIFRADDPLLQVTLASEHRVKLERLLSGLSASVFTADDSLGWVYQFWQSKKKEEVNASGDKITGDTLPAVTQLFTEHYMVLFLLHNTIGAWHAGKVLATNPKLAENATSEDELRRAVALKSAGGYSFDYLRFVRGADGKDGPWRPAAGTFDGWPKTAAELKMLDPCCGSGHFLVAGFELLVRLRMDAERLSESDAVDAVLRDNIHGLELDQRCTQIAAFNLAMAAWKLTGYRTLPSLNIACTGVAPRTSVDEWLKLAEKVPLRDRGPIRLGLKALHDTFTDAATLGSLIDPNRIGMVGAADFETLAPVLLEALKLETSDDERADAVTAQGLLKAAELLAGPDTGYSLVITNVPYLGRGKQDVKLQTWAEENEFDAKADLATIFISRSFKWFGKGGTLAVVSPQNWLFLKGYKSFRKTFMATYELRLLANLGEDAWQIFGNRGPQTTLLVSTAGAPCEDADFLGIDVATRRGQTPIAIEDKKKLLTGDDNSVSAAAKAIGKREYVLQQQLQLSNPDHAITLSSTTDLARLLSYADCYQGISTGDNPATIFYHFELGGIGSSWSLMQGPPSDGSLFEGRNEIMRNSIVDGESSSAAIRGHNAWGKLGVAIAPTGICRATPYLGQLFPNAVPVIIPRDSVHLLSILAFCQSPDYERLLRQANSKVAVDNGYATKVPFDLAHWQQIAAEKYPNGLPEPESDDPTQWLFHGRPEASGSPLQVAIARLMGYRWPSELDEQMRLSKRARALVKSCDQLLPLRDDDGIICIPSVRGEESASERLLIMLTACGLKADRDLDDFVRNLFFEEHCKLFHHRPFIWHIWDGRKRDGFSALVNYHKLADGKKGRKLLESLTYSYLGDWISRQHDGVKHGTDGAEDRLGAAAELQKRLATIIEGEPPFDLFVRWKKLAEQPIGWEPDIDDGVRINIRPFLASDIPGGKKGAGILRVRPGSSLHWKKDRGNEPERKKSDYPWFWGWDESTDDFKGGKEFTGERFNDCHYTNAVKEAARDSEKEGGKL